MDGNKVVLSVSNPETRVDDAEFEENEVYAIDIAASTGEGKVCHFRKAIYRHNVPASDELFHITCSQSCWMRSRQLSIKELLTRIIT